MRTFVYFHFWHFSFLMIHKKPNQNKNPIKYIESDKGVYIFYISIFEESKENSVLSDFNLMQYYNFRIVAFLFVDFLS